MSLGQAPTASKIEDDDALSVDDGRYVSTHDDGPVKIFADSTAPVKPHDPNAAYNSVPTSDYYFPKAGTDALGPTANIVTNGDNSTYTYSGRAEEVQRKFSPANFETQGYTKTTGADGTVSYTNGTRTVTFATRDGRLTYTDTDLGTNIQTRYPRPTFDTTKSNLHFSAQVEDALAKAAFTAGVSLDTLRTYAGIESSGRPGCQTGQYCGLLQLSNAEFQKYVPGGNIFDAHDNALAGALKLAKEAKDFQAKYGHTPNAAELYMVHQQGSGGAAQHILHPERLAWVNMANTGEGRQRGEEWAKKAIWGNVPDQFKKIFGSVDNITSQDFMNMWAAKTGTSPVLATDTAAPVASLAPDTANRNDVASLRVINPTLSLDPPTVAAKGKQTPTLQLAS